MDDAGAAFAEVLADLPLYAPEGERRRGRISSTALAPGGDLPLKVVVDFGSTPHGPDHGPELEIATRRWDRGALDERDIRGFCGERDLMERRMRDPLSAQSFSLPEGAVWSRYPITVDGTRRTFTVLCTAHSWVAAAPLPGSLLVRVFTPAPGPGPAALRRITSIEDLEPVRGRG
ncbi:MAG: hypothetical protein M0026_17460 [Nocardiopsaceae bacterium]|nr:hypothetical protein [Nocardiopsaceae bacterium]